MSNNQAQEPESSRPNLPSQYGILGPTEGKGLLPWAWAVERLERSRDYWLVTVQATGAPHAVVVWGVWLQNRFYFTTIANSRKGRNLAMNPQCVVCVENADEAISVEGVAEKVIEATSVSQFATAYADKYGEEADTSPFLVYYIRPLVAFASISTATDYAATATRWRFPNI